eukprot:3074136-Pleurochrysis_carterae.AAC.1
MKTGTQSHVDKFCTVFCSATCYLRVEAQEPSKLAPRVAEGIHLDIDQRRGRYFVYTCSTSTGSLQSASATS